MFIFSRKRFVHADRGAISLPKTDTKFEFVIHLRRRGTEDEKHRGERIRTENEIYNRVTTPLSSLYWLDTGPISIFKQ